MALSRRTPPNVHNNLVQAPEEAGPRLFASMRRWDVPRIAVGHGCWGTLVDVGT